MYDSPVICDYLNDRAKGDLIPFDQKFWVLKVQALCDGILDAAVNARYETHFRPASLRSKDWYNRQMQCIYAGLESLAEEPLVHLVNLATLAAAVTLSYLELRYPFMVTEVFSQKIKDWHDGFLSQHPWISDITPKDSLPLPPTLVSLIQ